MEFERKTVAEDAFFEGHGLHTGISVRVAVRPGSQGIWFTHGRERVRAAPENVASTDRCTTIGSIATIEHIMSAFAGLGITDAEVELSGPELPALDGSSLEYVRGLADARLAPLGWAVVHGPFPRLFVQVGDVRLSASKGEGHWRYRLLTHGRWPGEQIAEYPNVTEAYTSEIAPARTWCFGDEVEVLRSLGLGRGLSLESTLIIGEEGYMNAPRFPDEPARHKLLDLIGDLYLSGAPPGALNVTASRSGHATHVRLAALIRRHVKIEHA